MTNTLGIGDWEFALVPALRVTRCPHTSEMDINRERGRKVEYMGNGEYSISPPWPTAPALEEMCQSMPGHSNPPEEEVIYSFLPEVT